MIEGVHVNNAFMYFCSVSYDDIKKCNEEKKIIYPTEICIQLDWRVIPNSIFLQNNIFMERLAGSIE